MGRQPALLVGFLAIFVASPHAQLGYLWTFDELTKKADVVVIAEYVRTDDTGRTVNHPELKPDFPMIEMRTELKILAVLKPAVDSKLPGVAVGTSAMLRHYRKDWTRWDRDHPAQPGKPAAGVMNTGGVLEFRERGPYLLFLTKSSDGAVYEPLSGQTWPGQAVFSVRDLEKPPR